jgi:hypothetical protein
MQYPEWWHWELELTPHLEKRMLQRGFTEIDLRKMLSVPLSIKRDIIAHRWRVEARYQGNSWHVIIEPDSEKQTIVVITAFMGEE